MHHIKLIMTETEKDNHPEVVITGVEEVLSHSVDIVNHLKVIDLKGLVQDLIPEDQDLNLLVTKVNDKIKVMEEVMFNTSQKVLQNQNKIIQVK
jgi:hypothetical protein